jgi:hypothetical protein
VELVGNARERGIAPESPEADQVLRDLFGDTDLTAVLERIDATHSPRLARYRELLGILKGAPVHIYAEEFAWVGAALRARTGG